jgi:tetratricopeptide (TPR) repeat protein
MPKPEWILLTDFGLAKIVGGSMLTQSGLAVGTPAYMSPEQGSGKRVDKRTDIYALGIMLYEMVVGEVPYKAETPMAVVVKHIVDPLPMPRAKNPDVPEALQRVILKAMAKEPNDRYQRAGEIAEAIQEVVEEVPGWSAAEMITVSDTREPLDIQAPDVQSTAPSPAQEPPKGAPVKTASRGKRKKRKPWAAALAALGVVAVLATVGLLFGDALWEQIQPDYVIETPSGGSLTPSPPKEGDAPLPAYDRHLFEEASRLLDIGQPDQARDLFKRALSEDPGRWDDFIQIIHDVYNKGDIFLAVDLLEVGFSVAGINDLPTYEWLGWLYLDENRVEDAKNLFRQMVKEHPEWGPAYEGLVVSFSQTDSEQAAVDFLETMADQFPDETNIPIALGELYLNLEDYTQAEEFFESAIQMDPNDPWGYMQIAGVYVALGDDQRADEAIRQSLELVPDDGSLLDSAAWWYLDMERYDQAVETFRKAIEYGYNEPWTHVGLAQSLMGLGGAENMIRDALEFAEREAGQDAWLLSQIGWIYVDMGDCPRALTVFQSALEIDPTLFEAQDGLDTCDG